MKLFIFIILSALIVWLTSWKVLLLIYAGTVAAGLVSLLFIVLLALWIND